MAIEESNKNKEEKSFFQWVNFFIPYVYSGGIMIIVLWMVVSSVLLGISVIKEEPMVFLTS